MKKIMGLIFWVVVLGLFLFATDRIILRYNVNNDMLGGGNGIIRESK